MSSRRSGFSSTPGSTGLIVAGAGGVAHATAGIQFDVLGSIYCADATGDVAPNDLYIAAAGAFATATGANRTPGTVHYLTGVPTNGSTAEGSFTWERNFVSICTLKPTSANGAVYNYPVTVAIQCSSGSLQDGSGNIVQAWGTEPIWTVSTVNFGSDANLTATAAQYRNRVLRLTSSGALTATRNLTLPLTAGANHMVHNVTTGGQSIQVIGATGTGVTIANGTKAEVYSDGTNWY